MEVSILVKKIGIKIAGRLLPCLGDFVIFVDDYEIIENSMKRLFFTFLLFSTLVACSDLMISPTSSVTVTSDLPIPSPSKTTKKTHDLPSPTTIKEIPTNLSTKNPTTTFTPSIIKTPTPPSPQKTPFSLQIKNFCPKNREVEIQDLEIPENASILLLDKYDNSKGILMITGGESSIKPIPATIPEPGWYYSFSGVDPSGRYLLFEASQESRETGVIFIVPIDGSPPWNIGEYEFLSYGESEYGPSYGTFSFLTSNGKNEWSFPDLKFGPSWSWDKNSQVITNFGFGHSGGPSLPILKIDPHSQEGVILHDSDDIWTYFLGTYLVRQNDFALYFEDWTIPYLSEEYEYYLYDRDSRKTQKAFLWLKNNWEWDSPELNVFNRVSFWTNDKRLGMLLVTKLYGFDLGSDLDYDTLIHEIDYSAVMKPFSVPPGYGDWIESIIFKNPNMYSPSWVSRDGYLFDIQRLETNTARHHFIVDLRHFVLRNYCINPRKMKSSFDGRFVAWDKVVEETENKIIYEIVIMDLETGLLTKIPGYSLAGWGTMDRALP